MQMASGSSLAGAFVRSMAGESQKLINILPDDLKPPTCTIPVWPGAPAFINGHENPQGLTTIDQDAFNIVVLGPTGSGKSAITNRWFNMKVCESKAAALSVTKEMALHSGRAIIGGRMRKVNVMDSIGFCDSKLTSNEVLNLAKDALKVNMLMIDRVVIVLSGRIEAAHVDSIKTVLKWLKYSKGSDSNYTFIYNKADTMATAAEATQNILYMSSLLEIGKAGGYLVPTASLPSTVMRSGTMRVAADEKKLLKIRISCGIPPRSTYDEAENEHLKVLDATMCSAKNRLTVKESMCLIL
jgi:GTP-binding protein EngB required for normal cell division